MWRWRDDGAAPVTSTAFSAAFGDGTVGGIPTACFSGNSSLWIAFALESAPDAELGARIPITSSGYAHFALTPAGPPGPNDVTGNLTMVNSTASTGNILKGGVRFMHNFGVDNAFLGREASNLTMTGPFNTGIGRSALTSITSGSDNTGTGVRALSSNSSGTLNVANGVDALVGSTTGDVNTAVGVSALRSNTTGNRNTAVGYLANVSAGNLTNATAIGAGALATSSNMVRLGDNSVTTIEGRVAYSFTSDSTKKENFRPVNGESVLQKISGFRPRSWNYIGHDPKQFRHYGPMAQEFYNAFGQDGIGTIGSPTTINSGDIAGILMVAVQTLAKENATLKAALLSQNAELRARLDALERTVATGGGKQ